MGTLVIAALVVMVTIVAMGIYIKFHPPDASELGVQRLRVGLRLGTVSSATIVLVFVFMSHFPVDTRNLFLVLLCVAGNIVNLMGLVDCLRELNGESLFAALLLAFNQLLWVVCSILVILYDF